MCAEDSQLAILGLIKRLIFHKLIKKLPETECYLLTALKDRNSDQKYSQHTWKIRAKNKLQEKDYFLTCNSHLFNPTRRYKQEAQIFMSEKARFMTLNVIPSSLNHSIFSYKRKRKKEIQEGRNNNLEESPEYVPNKLYLLQ